MEFNRTNGERWDGVQWVPVPADTRKQIKPADEILDIVPHFSFSAYAEPLSDAQWSDITDWLTVNQASTNPPDTV